MNIEYYPHRFGRYAEEQVCKYLQQQELQLVERNYTCRYGEIDLIMQDQDCVVFVEVRARADRDFRDSLESVDCHKQHKVIRAATYYLQKTGQLNRVFCRFDVVAVKLQNEQWQFHWVKNAFC